MPKKRGLKLKNKNPLSKQDKIAQRLPIDLTTDKFGEEEQKRIIQMVVDDVQADEKVLAEWKTQKELDLKHLDGAKPSRLENLTKRGWQSDRNLGLCQAVSQSYQATLFATCWNPDSMHFVATEKNDIDNKDKLERFSKWMVGKSECNLTPEIDDFIENKRGLGFSMFHVYWDVWYEWVDRRIPKKDGGYTIKTEKMRFEKGVMENISDLDDILLPRYGKYIQSLPHMIHIIHKYGHEMEDLGKRNIFMNVDKEWIEKAKLSVLAQKKSTMEREKATQLGLSDVTDEDLRALPIDIHVWYGIYKKGKKTEKYRFYVDIATETFLGGKPLRKVIRTGKYPFVGGPFIKKPGQVKGKSLTTEIAPIVNAVNNTYNQKSDFQTITNMPFGFHKIGEGYLKQIFELEPGISYPTEGNPSEDHYFPNLQRSMAWAYNDIKLLFEILEKLTGAASYFQTTERNVSGTATRDKLVAEQSNTRFGLWVTRIMEEICEGIDMLVSLYQDKAPPKLGERVLGDGGKQLFPNLSVKDLRGRYDSRMEPNITAGSKAYEKDIYLWGFEKLQQTVWFDPRVNPKGNWQLVAETMKKMGIPTHFMPPEPPAQTGTGQEVKDEWARFMQGEVFDPGPKDNIMEHLLGHMEQKREKYHELEEEYRPNFDMHLFKTQMQFTNFIRQTQQEKMSDNLAMNMIRGKEAGIGEQERGSQRIDPGVREMGEPPAFGGAPSPI